jgi:ParB family chromosome partitioning protein
MRHAPNGSVIVTITDSPHEAEQLAAVPDEPVGELLHVDPASLVIGTNTRLDPRLDKDFIRSVRDRGVREPIIARRRDDGALVVRKGKRRTLAAVETGRPLVRVLVEPEPEPVEPAATDDVERIIDQLEENGQRLGNTDAELVAAHQQLLDLGLTAGQIARRTHVSTKAVKVTTTVARSELAAAVLARYDIPLDQAAVIAEFDDGSPDGVEAVKVLTVAAQKEPQQFDHVAQRLRDQRDDLRLVAERRAELIDSGLRVLDPDEDGPTGVLISGLRPAVDDPSGTELTPELHASCPGHAADVEIRRGFDRVPHVQTRYWCTDPDGNGHKARWDRVTVSGGLNGPGERRAGPMTDEEKAERRTTIANNKAWESATTVRLGWLRRFCTRKTPPKDAAVFIADTLIASGHDLRRALETQNPLARDLLGLPVAPVRYPPAPDPAAEAIRTSSPARATMISLAVLLGAAEAATSRDSWRNATGDTRTYFATLVGWGYQLSEVEQLVLGPADGAAQAGEPTDDPEAATAVDESPAGEPATDDELENGINDATETNDSNAAADEPASEDVQHTDEESRVA